MIRAVRREDVAAITAIYNVYVEKDTATFELDPVSVEEMARRVAEISSVYPYLVCEEEGKLVGYAYVHAWKSKEAYDKTLETTVYLAPGWEGMGYGRLLMDRLIEMCRERGYHALIACITAENMRSRALHTRLGFKQVSHFEQVGWKFGRWLDVVDFQLLL